ncbi:MAG TPA: glycosyltransferase [Hydrogenispora sp.]|jgi:GT2 family glycosyltransferase|nr:glycosyltransferase [Hydrogenispora sp.]
MGLNASVVIPTYNSQFLLTFCLRALFNQTVPPTSYELIVVDDGSTDETPAVVAGLQEEAPCALRYIRLEHSGRARARNTGALAARAPIIIFLDSDMIVRREFIASHLDAHTRPGLVVIGSVLNTPVPADPNEKAPQYNDYSRAFFATGNVSVQREKLIAAGLFDESFVEYGWEDLELGHRLRQLGLKRVKSLSAWSYHVQAPVTSEKIPAILQKERERGHMAVLFYRKHPSFSVKMVTLISPVFFAWIKFLTPFRWPERPGATKLLTFCEQKGYKFAFNLILSIMRSYVYVQGLKEAMAKKEP